MAVRVEQVEELGAVELHVLHTATRAAADERTRPYETPPDHRTDEAPPPTAGPVRRNRTKRDAAPARAANPRGGDDRANDDDAPTTSRLEVNRVLGGQVGEEALHRVVDRATLLRRALHREGLSRARLAVPICLSVRVSCPR